MNAFGRRLRISLFGESHGPAIGAVIDGMPPGIAVDAGRIQARLDQRRPGTGPLVSARQESDTPEILSGVFEGHTTGAPLCFIIRNEDTRSKDYSELRRKPRPGHSDLVARHWSRGHYDHRGGGHYSGRLTAPLVAAAAIVEPMLASAGITVAAHLHQAGGATSGAGPMAASDIQDRVAASPVHAASHDDAFVAEIEAARGDKDSIGGTVRFQADGVPRAWGDPFFDSIESHVAHILFSIPAVKGVSFGDGFAATKQRGSDHNDAYRMVDGQAMPTSNHAGGILGGRTTGAPVWGEVAIKPTSSIFRPQDTVDLDEGADTTLELKGRHDPCIAVRAVPVIRAAVELALADFLLLARLEGHAEGA